MTKVAEGARVTYSKETQARLDQEEAERRAAAEAEQAEIARTLGETKGKRTPPPRPDPHPGYPVLTDSVKLALRVAHAHGTSMTNKELWPRVDFSVLAADDKQPSFEAFCTWLRNRVADGTLVSRHETEIERSVRLGATDGKGNRPASLFALASLTDSPPEVTKVYDEYEPLTDEQKAWMEQHNPIRKPRTGKAEAPVETKVQTVEQAQEVRKDVTELIEAGQKGAAAAGRNMARAVQGKEELSSENAAALGKARRRPRPTSKETETTPKVEVMVFDSDLGAKMQERIDQLEAENTALRQAAHFFGQGIAALTSTNTTTNGDQS